MFSERKIKVEITLYDYKIFSNGNLITDFSSGKILTFDNFRTDCKINKVPSSSGYTASVDIIGVSKESLEQMTMMAWLSNGQIKPRGIRIYADDGEGYYTLFEGGIMEAVPVYKNAPDVAIHIESSMLVYPNLKGVPPISIRTGTNISSFCKELCRLYNVNCTTDSSINEIWTGGGKTFNGESLGDRLDALKDIGVEYIFWSSGVHCYKKGISQRREWFFNPSNYNGYPTFETFGICIETDSSNLDKENAQ